MSGRGQARSATQVGCSEDEPVQQGHHEGSAAEAGHSKQVALRHVSGPVYRVWLGCILGVIDEGVAVNLVRCLDVINHLVGHLSEPNLGEEPQSRWD